MNHPVRASRSSPALLAAIPGLAALAPELQEPPAAQVLAPRLATGACGEWGGRPFQVTGGYTLAGDAGFEQLWHLAFEDSDEAWLSQSDGAWTLREEVELAEAVSPFDALRPATVWLLGGEEFLVWSQIEAHCVAVQGQPGTTLAPTVRTVDLRNREASTLLDWSGTEPQLYLCTAVDGDALKLVPGSSTQSARDVPLVTEKCPSCQTPLQRARGLSAFATCPSCLSVLDLCESPVRVLARQDASSKGGPRTKPAFTLTLKVGSSGTLLGSLYTVLGACAWTAHELGETVRTTEYFLYDPQGGALQLIERSDGTWWTSEDSRQAPTHNTSDAWLDGARFRLTHTNVATANLVEGCLPRLVAVGDSSQCMEFLLEGLGAGLRDGTRLVREVQDRTLRWKLFSPLEPQTVLKAFDVEAPAIAAPRRRPVEVSRTKVADLQGPLRLTGWGNAALWVTHPTWFGVAVAGLVLVAVCSLTWFSWLFEGERL